MMDDEVYHWITLILLIILIALVGLKETIQDKQTQGLQFIIEQCITETPANLTWKEGSYTIQAVDNSCVIRLRTD